MLLQEKNLEKALHLSTTTHHTSKKVKSTESGMHYDLSNKKKMECERYQDCSWFQQDLMKGNINKKLLLAEESGPIIDPNEFDFATHLANAHTIPWEDDYLEVFDDDILQERFKSGDKNRILSPSFGNSSYPSCKLGDDSSTCDEYNFGLIKTDSFDSMKNISTNPADIIPITYKERINNSNYGQAILTNLKNETEEGINLNSSTPYVLASNVNELSIGREEIVEVEDEFLNTFNQKKNKKNISEILPSPVRISLDAILSEPIKEEFEIKSIKNELEEEKQIIQNVQQKVETDMDKNKTQEKKSVENHILAKDNFEQSVCVNTPDLDFMDLVDFINKEIDDPSDLYPATSNYQFRSLCEITSPAESKHIPQGGSEDNIQTVTENAFNDRKTNLIVDSTVNSVEMPDLSSSIAERIKTNLKRRVQKICIKDTEDSESSDDGVSFVGEDKDFSITESSIRQTNFSRKRSKSITSESSSCSKRSKEEPDNYRERRDKNNEASRRSRQNRKVRESLMYKTLEEEEKRNVKLKAESNILEKQVTSLRQLLLQVVLKKSSVV